MVLPHAEALLVPIGKTGSRTGSKGPLLAMRRRDFIAILAGMAVTPPKERVSQCPQASTLRTEGQ